MKNYISSVIIVLLFTLCLLDIYSCKKDYYTDAVYDIADSTVSYFKIADLSPNFASITGYNTTDSFDVYIDGEKINGSTSIYYGSTFPTSIYSSIGGITNTYSMITPGEKTITLVGAENGGTAIVTYTKTFEKGRFYSLVLTDSLFSQKDSSKIFVEDNFTANNPTTGYYALRLINAVTKDSSVISTGTNTVDLYSTSMNDVVVSKVKPNDISSFVKLPYNYGGGYSTIPDTLYVTRTPSTSGTVSLNNRVILAQYIFKMQTSSTAGIGEKRVYTFYYYGNGTISSGTKSRALSYYINR